jgi:hypothetical protein
MLTKFSSVAAGAAVASTYLATEGEEGSLAALGAALKHALSSPSLNPDHPWASALSADDAEVAALVLPALGGAGAVALATAYVGAYFYYQVQGQSNAGASALKWLCDQLQSLWNLSAPQARAVASMLQKNISEALSNATNLAQLRRELEASFGQVVRQFSPSSSGTTAPASPKSSARGTRLSPQGSGGSPRPPSLAPLLASNTPANQAERLYEQTQQLLAQFYWNAAGGKAALVKTRGSLKLLKQTASALAAITAPSGTAIAKLKTSLPLWLQQAQRYLNNGAHSGQSARLPQPPTGVSLKVKEAAHAASVALQAAPKKTGPVDPSKLGERTEKQPPALTRPGEKPTFKSSKPGAATGLEAQQLEQAYWDKVRAAADAVLEQLRHFPHMRTNINKLIEAAAQQFQISNLEHLARAVEALGNQLQAGATGGVRASGQTGSSARTAGTPTHADSDSPTEEPTLEKLKARIASLPFDTGHLQVVRDEGSGGLSLTVDPNKLDLDPRKAYFVLLNKFGEAGLTQRLASLIMPSPGLAPASPKLDPETQLQLAKIIFNEPTRKTINDLGQHRADDSIGHSLGALVLLQMGLLPSSREVFTAMREAFESLGKIGRSPWEIVRGYAPTTAELDRAARNQSTSGRPELSHLAFAALVASMLAKPEIHNKMKRSEDRPPFFEIQSRLLQLLESELNRSSSAGQENPVLDVTGLSRAWSGLSREQMLSVVADTLSRVFQLRESCGVNITFLQDKQDNDPLGLEYILNAIGQYNGPDQLDALITELRNRFKTLGANLPNDLVGEGAWNDNLISSLIRHALAQALALKRTDADGQGQPQPQPYKRWLKMSEEERRRFLSDPTRAEQTQRWLALTAEQRLAILKKVIHEAMNLPD